MSRERKKKAKHKNGGKNNQEQLKGKKGKEKGEKAEEEEKGNKKALLFACGKLVELLDEWGNEKSNRARPSLPQTHLHVSLCHFSLVTFWFYFLLAFWGENAKYTE